VNDPIIEAFWTGFATGIVVACITAVVLFFALAEREDHQ
jgi:hypothetical protein